jgi:hypothetical protein
VKGGVETPSVRSISTLYGTEHKWLHFSKKLGFHFNAEHIIVDVSSPAWRMSINSRGHWQTVGSFCCLLADWLAGWLAG